MMIYFDNNLVDKIENVIEEVVLKKDGSASKRKRINMHDLKSELNLHILLMIIHQDMKLV